MGSNLNLTTQLNSYTKKPMAYTLQQRDIRIDIVRGLAIIGIVLVNANIMNSPPWAHTGDFAFQTSKWDSWASTLVNLLFTKKTYPIFAFLFGYSAEIFLTNLQQKSRSLRHWYQRMAALLMFGILDVALIWWGDILINYALLGLLLPIFTKMRTDRLGYAVIVTLMLLLLLSLLLNFSSIPEQDDSTSQLYTQNLANLAFLPITKQRIYDFYLYNFWGYGQLPVTSYWFLLYLGFHLQVFWLMLLGIWCCKAQVFNGNKYFKLPKLKSTLMILLLLIFLMLILSISSMFFVPLTLTYLKKLLLPAVLVLLIMYLLNFSRPLQLLSIWAQFGRMSLTVYLGSSFIFSIILYGYGGGWYGQVGPATMTTIGVLIIAAALWGATWWLKHFTFGPLETIFKWATYL